MKSNSNMKANQGKFKRNRPQNIRYTIARLWHYLKAYKFRLALVVLFVLLSCLANVAGVYFLKILNSIELSNLILNKLPVKSIFIADTIFIRISLSFF